MLKPQLEHRMHPISRPFLAAALLAVVLLPVTASSQGAEGTCILAGRLADDGHWAPRFAGVELLAADGKPQRAGGREALAGVRQVRLAQPALLARCDGNGPLARADDEPPGAKQPAPAVSAGLVEVDGVGFPPLRTGGTLVELRVRVPAERIVMLNR
jgi:hypothetical protein